ncbi:GSCOCG00003904001-RA-CDS [Cotesia congregata]|nr:GSCOCG00003904001-RA-CDS [Cotesia congregata]
MCHHRHSTPWALSRFQVCALTIIIAVIVGSNNVLGDLSSEFVKGKICIGTNGRISAPSNTLHHYRNLRDRYTNCTYVDGNLEITWLQNDTLDLSFLQYIREVTGYVLISHCDVRRIVLPRLQIIRGRTLFKLSIDPHEFALIVTMSQIYNLELPALRDILNGSVGMYHNYNLCHVKTINWDEIISGPQSKYVYVYNFTSPERSCPACDPSCVQGCWGEGPENCQKFSKTNCSPQCWQGRCFGSQPRECCHLFCAGGCTGPKQSDCLACKSFMDDGVCSLECPPMQTYNPTTYSWEINPNGKYAYGATCVRKCPEHLLKDNGACVRSCPPKKKAKNGECVPCDGPCPKTCPGVDQVHFGNIESFRDCTVIEGSITIMDHSFTGFQDVYANYSFGPRWEPMHPRQLEVFSTLKEITGYLNIQGNHKDFTDLRYFRNLEVIGGRQLTEYFASLYVVKTALVSFGLSSLKRINSGSVVILENKDLCYAQSINWNKIKNSSEHASLVSNNKNITECKKEGQVCDEQCSDAGCWGPGPSQCLSCKNFLLDNECLENCSIVAGIYQANSRECKHCHEECDGTCNGPKAENCNKCKHMRDGPFCVKECPTSKYNDNGICKPCHKNCVGGCEGPENNIGPNGCHSCEKAIMNNSSVPEGCLQKLDNCPEGYFYEWVSPQEKGPLKLLAGKAVCRRCHPLCKNCTGYGSHEQVCRECLDFKLGENCVHECPESSNYILPNTSPKICIPCASECDGCYGPESHQCYRCRSFKVHLDTKAPDNTSMFNCTNTCPAETSYKVTSEDGRETYCESQTLSSQLEHEMKPKGERLPQPAICSIDVYMIMVKCWMLDAESRPTFKELADEFAKMSRDPGRYLAIKGDKYMRLPSYSMQDEKEMIRNLASAAEGPEALVDADEYLQPKSRAPIPPGLSVPSITDSPPNTPIKTCWPNGIPSHAAADSPTPQNQQNWDRELLSTDNRSSRYCSDPLKIISGVRDCDVTDDCFQPEVATIHQQAQVGNLKLDLPLDEDDYLMPSPQIPANATQYMDLIGDTKPNETEPKRLINGYRKYPEFLSIAGKTSLDNPEYIMGQDDPPLSPQIIGIPTTDLDKVLANGAFGSQQVKQRCAEEESDHEYYNDFDRLERERQPLNSLRKNETTV